MYIFGSGASIKELNKEYFKKASKSFSFAVGRWYVHEFVPDILFLETGNSKLDFSNILDSSMVREKDFF